MSLYHITLVELGYLLVAAAASLSSPLSLHTESTSITVLAPSFIISIYPKGTVDLTILNFYISSSAILTKCVHISMRYFV